MLYTLTIDEQGNGLPAPHDLVEDHRNEDIYRILAYDRANGAFEVPDRPGASHRIRVVADKLHQGPTIRTAEIHDSIIREIEERPDGVVASLACGHVTLVHAPSDPAEARCRGSVAQICSPWRVIGPGTRTRMWADYEAALDDAEGVAAVCSYAA